MKRIQVSLPKVVMRMFLAALCLTNVTVVSSVNSKVRPITVSAVKASTNLKLPMPKG